MRSRFLLPLMAVVSLLAITVAFVFRPLPTTITPSNADRVKPGMTVAEVTSILGEPRNEVVLPPPPIDEVESLLADQLRLVVGRRQKSYARGRWIGESWQIVVDLDTRQTVLAVHVSEYTFGSAWEFAHWRVRRVLGLAPDESTGIVTDPGVFYRVGP